MHYNWERAVAFHGHACPGLAIGVRAAEAAIKALNVTRAEDEEIVCVTENDACGVDGIQVLLGCTFGKGNLIYRNSGKQAFSFFNRKSGECVRIILKTKKSEMDRDTYQKYLLEAPLEEIFDYSKPKYGIPEKARLFFTVFCDKCGEGSPEHKMHLQNGQMVCSDCFEDYSRGF